MKLFDVGFGLSIATFLVAFLILIEDLVEKTLLFFLALEVATGVIEILDVLRWDVLPSFSLILYF